MNLGHDSHADDNGGICCHLLAVCSVLGPVLNTAGGTPWSLPMVPRPDSTPYSSLELPRPLHTSLSVP